MSPWRPLPEDQPDPRPVGDSLPRLLKSLRAPAPGVVHAVFSRWEELVGPMVAEHAWPVRLRDGALLVGVDEPAWVTHLGFLGPDLLRRLAAETGDQTVTRVELKVVPRRPR